MSGIYIYSEDSAIARQLVTAGLNLKKTMDQPVVVVTANDADKDSFAAAGADKVVVMTSANKWPEAYAKALGELLASEQAAVVLVGGTSRGKDVAAKLASILKSGLVTDAQSIEFADGKVQTTRMMYGGLALCTETQELPAMVTVAPRTFEEPAASDNQADVVSVDVATDDRIAISDVSPIARQGVDITEAERLVCVGRGIEKQEDMKLAEELADKLGAEIACSRGIAEDYHWLPIERYIGISGQKVKPELYLSLGVSGQVQHVAGLRDSRVIVAVDSNEKAPIFQAADYGIVGDLYEVVPLLTAALKK
jgi:electron transfer flavoprotein alpha subunit